MILLANQERPSPNQAALAACPEPAVSATPSRCILIVDDDADAAGALATLLQMSGHDVHVAYDGCSALKAAAVIRPETVLLDIGLPDVDGYEVARRLRRDLGLSGTIIIALSGYADEDHRRSADAGIDHHLVKPVDLEDLARTLVATRDVRCHNPR